jgi:hypothetical protein
MKLFQFLLAALLLISSAIVLADKPDPVLPNPPLAVRDANVDGNDWIRVHEQGTAKVEVQGTADVNVTGGQIDATVTGGSVTVNNTGSNPVPVTVENAEQDVYVVGGEMTVPTKVWGGIINMTSSESQRIFVFSNGPIYATTIHVSDRDDESAVEFWSPMLQSDPAFTFWDPEGAFIEHTHSFTYPIPISEVRTSCLNEQLPCVFDITVWGF